jgi:hypothetical protein
MPAPAVRPDNESASAARASGGGAAPHLLLAASIRAHPAKQCHELGGPVTDCAVSFPCATDTLLPARDDHVLTVVTLAA